MVMCNELRSMTDSSLCPWFETRKEEKEGGKGEGIMKGGSGGNSSSLGGWDDKRMGMQRNN